MCHSFSKVTIGSPWSKGVWEGSATLIEKNVFMGAGVNILGNIKNGEDVIIRQRQW